MTRRSASAGGILRVTCAFAIVLAAAPRLRAQGVDPAVEEEARSHFRVGVTAYEQGDFVTALREFRHVFEIRPSDGLRYNLGAALYKTGQLVEARAQLRWYLERTEPERITAERRQEIAEVLAAIDAAVGLLDLHIPVAGAQVTVDGLGVDPGPQGEPVALLPGRHDLAIAADGYEPFSAEVVAVAGERTTLDATLVAVVTEPIVAPPPPVRPPEPEPEPVPAPEETGLSDVWFWTAVGVAGALAVGGAVTGGLVLAKESDFDDAVARWHQGERAAFEEGQTIASDGEALGAATTGLFIAAGAVAATALVLGFYTDFGGERPDQPVPAIGLAPVAPAAGAAPGLALSATVRF